MDWDSIMRRTAKVKMVKKLTRQEKLIAILIRIRRIWIWKSSLKFILMKITMIRNLM